MREIIAGREVFEAREARKAAALGDTPPTGFRSETLCQWQRSEAKLGIVEAEIVKSIYGYGLRYASGLNNFGIIARAQEIGGSLEDAIAFAKSWQAADASRRFVSTCTV